MMAPLPREDGDDRRGRAAAPAATTTTTEGGGPGWCCWWCRLLLHAPGGSARCRCGGGAGRGGPVASGDCASAALGRPMERWCLRRRRRRRRRERAADGEGPGAGRPPPPRCGEGAATPLDPCGCERCLSCAMDYHQHGDGCYSNNINNNNNSNEYSCDKNRGGEEEEDGVVPPSRLPRSRICGDGGPSEGKGPRGVPRPPPAPLFLAADRRSCVTVASSSGRGGDGAAVHFPGDRRRRRPLLGGGTEESSCGGVGGTWCGRNKLGRGRCSSGGGVLLSRPSSPLVSLLWLSLAALLVGGASASIMGDGCDWSGSGLMAEKEVSREGGGVGVRPVYLRCSQGAVSWAYPRGALRVLLRLAGGGPDDEFRGCVRLGRTWQGARLFLEGVRSLHPLFPGVEDGADRGKGAGGGTGVRCFQSRKGQAALYVEATPGGVSPRGRTVASFEYHLQPLPSGVKSFDPSEECRPCTVEEMTHAFCSSDLVTRGTIRSVESHDDPETSELRVRVTKLIRRTRAPPPALEGDPFDEDDGELQEETDAASAGGGRAGRGRRHWWDSADRGASVTLHVPTHCGARHGAGEFVFMAQRKLGQLRLRCAPRLEDWAELARRSNRLAASPCVLQA